jgi:hypothetical protein
MRHIQIVDVDTEGGILKVFILTSTMTDNDVKRIEEIAKKYDLYLKCTEVTIFSFKRRK